MDAYKVIRKPVFVMMVGFPAAGKSTFVENEYKDFNHISSDNYVERVAKAQEKTYNDVFLSTIKDAEKYVNEVFLKSIQDERPIVLDRTNLSVGSRKKYLKLIPNTYHKVCHLVACSDKEEWHRRLQSRPGKNIPDSAIQAMIQNFEYPTLEEGFVEIIESDQFF